MSANHAFEGFEEVLNVTDNFLDKVEPYFEIDNNDRYEGALLLIESILNDPELVESGRYDFIIKIISEGIRRYEDSIPELAKFKHEAENIPADIATLRVLMSQHGLGVKDLPEIGTKGYISRILAGERNLTKQHIEKLSERFNISPALFFNNTINH